MLNRTGRTNIVVMRFPCVKRDLSPLQCLSYSLTSYRTSSRVSNQFSLKQSTPSQAIDRKSWIGDRSRRITNEAGTNGM